MEAEAIVERFRRAAFGIDSWSEAFAGCADATRANYVQLAALDPEHRLAFGLLHGTTPDIEATYMEMRGPDPHYNPRNRIMLHGAAYRSGIDDDVSTARQRAATPIYRDFFCRTGADHICMVPLGLTGDVWSLSVLRGGGPGQFDSRERGLLEAIAPAVESVVAQAMTLGGMMEDAMVRTGETLGAAVVLLDYYARPVACSPAAEAVLRAGTHLTSRDGRVVAAAAACSPKLNHAVAAAVDPRRLSTSARTVLRDRRGAAPMVVEVAPLPRVRSGPIGRARAMLTIRTPRPVEAQVLREAFALTMAEAEVAVLLCEGIEVAEIAVRRGCSAATVRSQMKPIFAKTDTTRQAELVARLRQLL